MIKVKVNNEYKDVVKIFCGGTIQKEITKVWSREAKEYVYESSVEYSGSLPITISADGNALIDYRIYGADGGVGEPTESGEPAGYKLPMTVMDNLAPPLSQWVDGYINVSGGISSQTSRKEKSSDFIEVKPSTSYVFGIEGNVFPQGTDGAWVAAGLYHDDRTFIQRLSINKNSPYTFSTSSETKYVRLSYRAYDELLEPRLSEFSFSIPVYIGENQLNADEYVSYGEQKIYKRTENLFELFADMKDADNWDLRKLYDFGYFIYYHLSPEQLTRLKSVGTVYGKAFKKEGGQYIRGTVLAITNKRIDTGVTNDMRLIQNNGNILNYSHDFTNDDDAYLCIGYGQGITEDTKQTYVYAILDNFDIMLSSTAPTEYAPYYNLQDPPVSLPEIPTIDGTTIIDYDGDPKPSQMYVKYRR